MYQDNGVGLAAPQVGVNVRLMVCNETGERGRGQEMILVNPEIVAASKATTTGEEGCLSFPGIYANVSRAVEIEVRAQNERAEVVQFKMSGWPAIIFQHEYDHLQGVLYHDRMAPSVLETVRPRLVELENSFLQSNPGVKVQRLAPPKVSKGFGS